MIAATYIPFVYPLPIWTVSWYWPLLLIPLSAAVAVAYKSVRCREISKIPYEAAELFLWIVLGMVGCALALAGLSAYMA